MGSSDETFTAVLPLMITWRNPFTQPDNAHTFLVPSDLADRSCVIDSYSILYVYSGSICPDTGYHIDLLHTHLKLNLYPLHILQIPIALNC